MEGSLFIVKRSFGCRFRLIILNRLSNQDLLEVSVTVLTTEDLCDLPVTAYALSSSSESSSGRT